MANDDTQEDIIEPVKTDEAEGEPEEPKDSEKKTEEKPKETPEARKSRLERQLKQVNKQLGIEEKSEPKKANGFDNAEKALLVAYGVKNADEMAIAESIIKKTGQSIEDVMEDDYFQAKIKTLRADRESKDAMPGNTKRPGNTTKDSVDYWLAKDQLPPEDQTELRRKVVNARIARTKSVSKFSTGTIEIR